MVNPCSKIKSCFNLDKNLLRLIQTSYDVWFVSCATYHSIITATRIITLAVIIAPMWRLRDVTDTLPHCFRFVSTNNNKNDKWNGNGDVTPHKRRNYCSFIVNDHTRLEAEMAHLKSSIIKSVLIEMLFFDSKNINLASFYVLLVYRKYILIL